LKKPQLATKQISFRNYKFLDINDLKSSISNSTLCDIFSIDDVNKKAVFLTKVLQDIIDSTCPIQTKTIKIRPGTAWFDEDIAEAKRARNKAERNWRHSGLTVHRDIYKTAKIKVTR